MIGQIEIPGEPIPQSRARGGKHGWYDPQALVKRNIATYVKTLIGDQKPSQKPLSVLFRFAMPIPKSWSFKKRSKAYGAPHAVKCDIDNLIKFYFDLLNNVLWEDDSQIYNVEAIKVYDIRPQTTISIKEYECD